MLAMERAISLGIRGATGTMSDSDRESVAAELDGIADQLFELANSSIQGIHLFGGTETTTPAFVRSGGSVTYQGSSTINDVIIGEGYVIRTGVPGAQVFGTDSSGVFASIAKLGATLRAGDDVTSPMAALIATREQMSTARVTYGNSLKQLESAEQVLNERGLQLAQQETDIAGADLADVATRLACVQTSRNALLSTIGKAAGLNLFDYLG
jgi:flagellar hook-associated protein 3 FlgL